jgi:hypothetical protein
MQKENDMTTVKTSLATVLTQVQQNRVQMIGAMKEAEKQAYTDNPDVENAIQTLIKHFHGDAGSVQKIGQMIGSRMQLVEFDRTLKDIEALIAGLQTLTGDDHLAAVVAERFERNTTTKAHYDAYKAANE